MRRRSALAVGHDSDVGEDSDLDAVPVEGDPPVAPSTKHFPHPNGLTVAALSGLAVGLALTLVVVVLDAGNGDADAGSNVCRLLDAADIAVVVGSAVESGRSRELLGPEPGQRSCGYPTSSPFGVIVVHEQRLGAAGFAASRRRARDDGGVPEYHPLTGLGDQAFSVGGAVFVLADDTFVVVGAQKPSRDFEPVARQLAARVVLELR
jgi:hypothetical protein